MPTAAVPANVAQWFAHAYGDPGARVLRSHHRTCGWLLMIEGEAGSFWLRIGGVMRRGLDAVEAEGRSVSDLAAHDIPVAKPRKRMDGRFAGHFELGGANEPAIAYEHLSGTEVAQPTTRQAERLGEAVAAFHALQPIASSLPLAEPIAQAAENVACCRLWLEEEDYRWLEESVERAQTKVASDDVATICHGDLRLGNVSFAGDQPTLFDFEGLCRAPRTHDLACLWRRRVIECRMTESIPDWESFLRGYERQRTIVEDELRLLKLLAMLRAVWTMSLPAQTGAKWGADWLRDPDYWRDHLKMVRWFAWAAGL